METILCNLSDANQIISEARQEWITTVLQSMGINNDTINESDINKYRTKMEECGIEVILYSDGAVDVFKKVWHDDGLNQGWIPSKKENLVAQWKIPERVRRIDDKGYYYEIHIDEWHIKPAGGLKI